LASTARQMANGRIIISASLILVRSRVDVC
jgi:hypothetical protein